MRRRGAVQRKVPCLFVTEVKEEPSAKRERQVIFGDSSSGLCVMAPSTMTKISNSPVPHQPFKVLATETIPGKTLEADIYNVVPTEKVDGTCCYVTPYKGQPYLWARLDRKPKKEAEKRLKGLLYSLADCKGKPFQNKLEG